MSSMHNAPKLLAALAILGALVAPQRAAADGGGAAVVSNPWVLHIPVCSATDVMIGDLDQIDAEKGLGRGGPVVTAVEQMMRTQSAAPRKGVADLELVVLRDGSQSLRVLWAARQRADWEDLVLGVEHLVGDDQVRVPEKSLGMKIVVRVDARLEYPDGCPIDDHVGESPYSGGYAMGCGTRPIAAPEKGVTCRRQRRSTEPVTHVVHARILSEARIPDPSQPAQRTKS